MNPKVHSFAQALFSFIEQIAQRVYGKRRKSEKE